MMIQSLPLKTWSTTLCALSVSLFLTTLSSASLLDPIVNLAGGYAAAAEQITHLTSSTGYPTTISGSKSVTLSAPSAGATVVINLADLILTNSAALTLKGDANTVFIINV